MGLPSKGQGSNDPHYHHLHLGGFFKFKNQFTSKFDHHIIIVGHGGHVYGAIKGCSS
jgi:hypothetical protein